MADSPRKRYSRSPSPLMRAQSRSRSRSPSYSRPRARSRSRSRGRSRSRSHGRDEDANPGNTLYVTGLSTRVTERDLEDHFSKEGKVASCFLVMEPRTRISRGFGFVTMDSLEGANRAVKYLNQSVLEGRYITVEKSRRKRPRTPTPGHYLGLKSSRDTVSPPASPPSSPPFSPPSSPVLEPNIYDYYSSGSSFQALKETTYGLLLGITTLVSQIVKEEEAAESSTGYRGGDRGRSRGGRDDYSYRRSPPRRSPPPYYRGGGGGRDYSPPRRSPPPYGGGYGGGRSRRDRSRSPIYYSPRGSR